MRFQLSKRAKAGILLGLLTIGIARPTADVALGRELTLRAVDPIGKGGAGDTGAGSSGESAGGSGSSGPHLGTGETSSSSGGSGSSGPHLGTGETSSSSGGSGDAGPHLGTGDTGSSGGGAAVAKPASYDIVPSKGQELLGQINDAINNNKPVDDHDYADKIKNSKYKKEITDSSISKVDMDKTAVTAAAKAWFKQKFGFDVTKDAKKIHITAGGWGEDSAPVYQAYAFPDDNTLVVTRTFRTFKDPNEADFYYDSDMKLEDRIQISELMQQTFTEVAEGKKLNHLVVGAIENPDTMAWMRDYLQRTTKASTGETSVTAKDGGNDWNLVIASSAGKSLARWVVDHHSEPAIDNRRPVSADIRYGDGANDKWIGFHMG